MKNESSLTLLITRYSFLIKQTFLAGYCSLSFSFVKASLLETAGRFFVAFYPLLFFLISQKTS